MTEQEALLAAIRAARDEDTPRLAYADWLDEHEEMERGEFIRVQCELANVHEPHVCGHNHGAGDCWVCRLRNRERELFSQFDFVTATPFEQSYHWPPQDRRHEVHDDTLPQVAWSRGFIAHVICTAANWLTHADAILAAQPIEQLTLTTPLGREFIAMHGGQVGHVPGKPGVWTFETWPGIEVEMPVSREQFNAVIGGVLARTAAVDLWASFGNESFTHQGSATTSNDN